MGQHYIYPKLFAHVDLGFARIGGNGLANCLFVYARAICEAKRTGAKLITPTWVRFSPSTYLRREKDKRHYTQLFQANNEITGIKKIFLMNSNKTKIISGLGNYFRDLIDEAEHCSDYIIQHINPKIKELVNKFDFTNCVAVHVRLGDYPQSLRTPLSFYKRHIIEKYKANDKNRFLVFSDGTDEELAELLTLPNVERVFFGSAIADILAISKCSFLIGSDSTFSGWGGFLGQVPCVFYRKHYGRILVNTNNEKVENI